MRVGRPCVESQAIESPARSYAQNETAPTTKADVLAATDALGNDFSFLRVCGRGESSPVSSKGAQTTVLFQAVKQTGAVVWGVKPAVC